MKSNWRSISPQELWNRRSLVWLLTVRDIKARYKQSVLGLFWLVVRPIIIVTIFSYVFGSVAKLPSNDIPYPLFVFAALIAWELFSSIIIGCANSIVSNKVIVERIYCPRLIFPIGTVLAAIFDFLFAFLVFLVILLVYGRYPNSEIIWLPILALGVIFAGLSIGIWLAAISVWFRDIKFAVTYLVQLMLLLTPIGYGQNVIPKTYYFIVLLNPLSSLIEAFRWCLLGTVAPNITSLLISSLIIFILLTGGILFFNKLERSFADVI